MHTHSGVEETSRPQRPSLARTGSTAISAGSFPDVVAYGHAWCESRPDRKFGGREVTIPITAVEQVATDTVSIALTEEEVGRLPSLPVHRWFARVADGAADEEARSRTAS